MGLFGKGAPREKRVSKEAALKELGGIFQTQFSPKLRSALRNYSKQPEASKAAIGSALAYAYRLGYYRVHNGFIGRTLQTTPKVEKSQFYTPLEKPGVDDPKLVANRSFDPLVEQIVALKGKGHSEDVIIESHLLPLFERVFVQGAEGGLKRIR
jgi:hypothetical protein